MSYLIPLMFTSMRQNIAICLVNVRSFTIITHAHKQVAHNVLFIRFLHVQKTTRTHFNVKQINSTVLIFLFNLVLRCFVTVSGNVGRENNHINISQRLIYYTVRWIYFKCNLLLSFSLTVYVSQQVRFLMELRGRTR